MVLIITNTFSDSNNNGDGNEDDDDEWLLRMPMMMAVISDYDDNDAKDHCVHTKCRFGKLYAMAVVRESLKSSTEKWYIIIHVHYLFLYS